ncbi:CDP-alcohol phosphatidyltransferase family protein [Chryseobacterium sp. BIGb0232]|uniref:CDP-alcohol phosphatidyltransferase family protein n=1 Tax=Chryseobacterium sp. BIGb0232 TaxID=2940598 RepID=UPI000F4998DB|nr:CDP-alcohol phosphatidyltransferase family protein [Chryseobacterium sp. BIGb0232]MCS4303360.1 CDP-diacylglycerol--glycerol-3-phosphate 3-phosphatidyltransferase [Chryseobacterium sp. BIGb0232]ROS11369.1 CDP-diacylglycerol--glycerol-3-phosphate 3-phosphatidyltransferase [Chryseobacterium nakagawai]
MISVYKLKPKFQQLLTPVLLFLNKNKITANQITISSILLSAIIGVLFWNADSSKWLFLSLPIGLLLRMALNALDGMMARRFNQTSKLGEVLNEVGDIVSDVIIFFPLLKFQPESIYLIVIFIVLSVINEFAGLIGKIVGKERRYDGPMGKSDRALILGLYGLLVFFGVSITAVSNYIIEIIIILLLISTYARLKKSLNEA